MSGMPDKERPADMAVRVMSELAELAAIEWQASGMADREAYGDTLVSESDVIGGYAPDGDFESAWGMWQEATYDPDYPLGR